MLPSRRITLNGDEAARLRDRAQDPSLTARNRQRSEIILLAASGRTTSEIARTLSIRPETANLWIDRFALHRMDGLAREAPRPRGRREADATIAERILRATRETPPPDPRGWTTRSLGRFLGVNHMRVHRVWTTHGVLGSPPVGGPGTGFVPFVDVAGFFLEPPGRAVVFAVGARWDRPTSATVLPVLPTSAERSGGYWTRRPQPTAADLLHALESAPVASPARRALGLPGSDLLIFLRGLEERTPAWVGLHAVVEPLGSEGSQALHRWAERRPRFRVSEVSEGGTLAGQCRAILAPWQATRLHRRSFAHAGPATEAIGRVTSVGWLGSPSFFWSPDQEPLPRIEPALVSLALGGPLPSNPWMPSARDGPNRTGPRPPFAPSPSTNRPVGQPGAARRFA